MRASSADSSAQRPKIYLARLDKIGDLVCTLGADQSLRDWDVRWVVQPAVKFVLEAASPSRQALFLESRKAWLGLTQLVAEFRRERPQAVISFQAPWWFSLAAFWARVPERWGVRSQWHSYFFLNHGVRQKRSRAEQHESAYNQDLLNAFLDRHERPAQSYEPLLLVSRGVAPELPEHFAVVHPGMAGSARNWPPAKFVEFIEALLAENAQISVVLTGTEADSIFVNPVAEHFQRNPRVINRKGSYTPTQLLAVLKQAQFVVAPSTGVLHLAAALGVPVYGVYSPVRVQQSRRWRPLGVRSYTFEPQVNCPADRQCLGEKCLHFDCMNLIDPKLLLQSLRQHGDLR